MPKFLLAYRNTAHSTTGEAPSVLFLGRLLRTRRLDLVKPDLPMKVKNRQLDQVRAKEHALARQLSVGQTVMARNYTGKDRWLPGTVQAKTGPLSYEIKVGPDRIWRRHFDQLRASSVKLNEPSDDTTDIEREEIDTAEPRPDREDTDQNTPAEDLVPEPDTNPERTAPEVQQGEQAVLQQDLDIVIQVDHINHPRSWVLTGYFRSCLLRKLRRELFCYLIG